MGRRNPTSEYVGGDSPTSEDVGRIAVSSESALQSRGTSGESSASCAYVLGPQSASAEAAGCAGSDVSLSVCRLRGLFTPKSNPEEGGTVAHPAAAERGIRDDMFFVGIQIQNRWTSAMFDTGASKT